MEDRDNACISLTQFLLELAPDDTAFGNRLLPFTINGGGKAMLQLVLDHFGIKLQPGIPPQHEALDDALLAGDLDIVKMFLDAGFDVNMRYNNDDYQPSLLDLAAESIDPLRAVALLLKRGADPKARSPRNGSTLLWRLISRSSMGEARVFVIRGLLQHGANPLARDFNGETPFTRAARVGLGYILHVFMSHLRRRNIPFEQIKDLIKEAATATSDPKTARYLGRITRNNSHAT